MKRGDELTPCNPDHVSRFPVPQGYDADALCDETDYVDREQCDFAADRILSQGLDQYKNLRIAKVRWDGMDNVLEQSFKNWNL